METKINQKGKQRNEMKKSLQYFAIVFQSIHSPRHGNYEAH